jgi:hypothetical protein
MSVVNVVLNKTVEINRFVHSALAIPARLDHPTNTIGTWTCAPPHVHIQPTWTWFPKDYIYCFFKVCSLQECKWYHIIDHEYYSVTTATCKHALHDLHGTIYIIVPVQAVNQGIIVVSYPVQIIKSNHTACAICHKILTT